VRLVRIGVRGLILGCLCLLLLLLLAAAASSSCCLPLLLAAAAVLLLVAHDARREGLCQGYLLRLFIPISCVYFYASKNPFTPLLLFGIKCAVACPPKGGTPAVTIITHPVFHTAERLELHDA